MAAKRKHDDVNEIRFFDQKKAYGELSNYWTTTKPIVYRDKTYATSEHLYQALKYDYAGAPHANEAHAEAIRTARTPAIAKALSNPDATVDVRWAWQEVYVQKARDFRATGSTLDPRWNADTVRRVQAMRIALREKFLQDAHCRDVLLKTGERRLFEASPYDDFWGTGKRGDGLNMLGQLLEQLRSEFKTSGVTLDASQKTIKSMWKYVFYLFMEDAIRKVDATLLNRSSRLRSDENDREAVRNFWARANEKDVVLQQLQEIKRTVDEILAQMNSEECRAHPIRDFIREENIVPYVFVCIVLTAFTVALFYDRGCTL